MCSPMQALYHLPIVIHTRLGNKGFLCGCVHFFYRIATALIPSTGRVLTLYFAVFAFLPRMLTLCFAFLAFLPVVLTLYFTVLAFLLLVLTLYFAVLAFLPGVLTLYTSLSLLSWRVCMLMPCTSLSLSFPPRDHHVLPSPCLLPRVPTMYFPVLAYWRACSPCTSLSSPSCCAC